jgi:hypothetical protein
MSGERETFAVARHRRGSLRREWPYKGKRDEDSQQWPEKAPHHGIDVGTRPVPVKPSCRPCAAFVEEGVSSRPWNPRIRQRVDPKAAA